MVVAVGVEDISFGGGCGDVVVGCGILCSCGQGH